jgi:hypothetical protein
MRPSAWACLCAVSALACGGRSLIDESASGGDAASGRREPIADAGPSTSTSGGGAGSGAGGRSSAGSTASEGGADAAGAAAGRGASVDAGIDASLDGGDAFDAGIFDAGDFDADPFDAGNPLWNTTAVVNPLPDPVAASSPCGECAADEVCHPGVGCEPACDIPTGIDPSAAWPIGGGCATRRGLSRYAGLKQPKLAFSLALGSSEASYSSAITLGENREIYVGGQADGAFGFLRIDRDGGGLFYPDWLGEVPVLAQNDVLYTVPFGLQATRRDGTVLWSLPSGFGYAGPFDQSGEPVVGADGTVYSAGIIEDSPGVLDDDTGLFAVSPAGHILWSVKTHVNIGMFTWPAIAKDGTIYFGAADGVLRAVSPAGKVLWQLAAGGYGWGYPAVDHAQNIYLGNGAHLWSLAPNGQTRWERDASVSPGDMLVFTHVAIGPDGTVFAPFYDQINSSFESGVRAYTPDGTLRWAYQDSAFGVSTPVVDRNGILYLTTTNTLHAFSPSAGELWSTQIANEQECDSVVLGADGTTFVKCGTSLYGFREGAP